MRPIIGMIPSIEEGEQQFFTNISNVQAIERAGGIPIVLPYIDDDAAMAQYARLIDGLYLAGGNDIDPSYYNEAPHFKLGEVNPRRDAFEWNMLNEIIDKNKPVLGVCKGAQMINVFFGGGLYQDIISQMANPPIQHAQKSPLNHPSHMIELVEGTKLHDIMQQTSIKVNSHHHQAIRHVGKNVSVSSRTSDGLIESIESTRHDFVLGVQWHPEELIKSDDKKSIELYKIFIEESKRQV